MTASARRARPTALIVDYGGVLTTSVGGSLAAFCLSSGVSPDRLRLLLAPAYAGVTEAAPAADGSVGVTEWVAGIETGSMSVEDFSSSVAALLSEGLDEPLDPAGLTERMLGGVAPDERMIGAVRRARDGGVPTALVSNTWGSNAELDGLTGLFDVMVLSGEVGLRKPEPAIFRLAAEELDVEPRRCVFVDDLPSNVDGARMAGMHALLHKDAAITVPKLEGLLGIPLG